MDPAPLGGGARAPVSADAHRGAARMFASGVTVATAAHGGRVHAIAATAFCSLSLDPPLVLLAIRRDGQLVDLVRGSGNVGISVLREGQRDVSEWAASPGRTPRETLPFATVRARTGAPLVDGAIAWFDCEVQSMTPHGDHVVLVGLVVDAWADGGARPLLYYRGTYHDLGRALGAGAGPLDD